VLDGSRKRRCDDDALSIMLILYMKNLPYIAAYCFINYEPTKVEKASNPKSIHGNEKQRMRIKATHSNDVEFKITLL